jgi:uncharacterized protein YjbI with pentapeptide repeats
MPSSTDFTRANLAGAKLSQADVNGANFRGVIGRLQIEALKKARNREKAAIFDAQ